MARIRLEVDEPALRLTLKAMLEAEGHALVSGEAELNIVDTARRAIEIAKDGPVLVLTTSASVPEAVQAMRRGAFGYVLVPLVPGEAVLMVQRALKAPQAAAEGAKTSPRLEDVERAHIEATLRQCRNNQAETARVLGIGRNTLWRKLKQYGVL